MSRAETHGGPAVSRPGAALLLALAGAAVLHLLLVHVEREPAPRRLWGDEILYADLAERAARGAPAEIELLWPPLYPQLLSFAARFGPLGTVAPGTPPGVAAAHDVAHVGPARAAVVAVQIALLLAAVFCLRAVAWRLTGSARAADLAATLALLDPHLAAFAHYLWPEVLHLALFLGALALLVTRPERVAAAAGAGVLLGLALLTKSLLQPFLPLLVAPLVVALGWRRGLPRALLVLALAAAVAAPTVIANGRRTGAYVIASSARFNLWVGLNDRAPRNFQREIVGDEYNRWLASGATFAEREARLTRRIEGFVAERGVLRVLHGQAARQYFRLFGAETFLTDQLPGGAVAGQGYGYAGPPVWAVRLLRGWSHAHYALVLLAAGFGFAFLAHLPAAPGVADARTRRAWLVVALAFLLYNLALFLCLHVKTRYRVPLLPVWHAAAALALARLAARGTSAALPALGGPRLAAGVLFAALPLLLAFWPVGE